MAGRFALDLSRIIKKAKGDTDLAARKVMLEAFTGVVQMSPVGNPDLWVTQAKDGSYVDYIAFRGSPDGYVGGRFRGNWQVGYGSINSNTDSPEDKSGATTIARIAAEVAVAPLMLGSIFLTNSLPYSIRLEEGWSTQAPVGMVGVTMTRIASKYGA